MESRNQVAEMVTAQVIKGLESGHIPWEKPWLTVNARNFITGHRYSGINTLLTAISCEAQGFKHPLFASFKQVHEHGG